MKKKLSWNELADLYDNHHSGRKARTLSMIKVFDWAEGKKKDMFIVDEEGFIYSKREEVLSERSG